MSPFRSASRISGLDTLRALAIILVLCIHYGVVVTQQYTFGVLSQFGWVGVDLFFVLSGYLIGGQITRTMASGESLSLGNFVARRALRTLPNYYAILALYLLFPAQLAGSWTAPAWQFFTFTQNFAFTHWGHTFSHSWSLCIEEQFYLMLPLVAIGLARLRRPLPAAWLTVAAVIATGMAMRAGYWHQLNGDGLDAPFYYSTATRFDELLVGVVIAMLQSFHRKPFERMVAHPNWLLITGLTGVAVTLFEMKDQVPDTLFTAMIGYPALAASFGLLVLSSLHTGSLLNRMQIPGARHLARWSYAIYLAHKPVYKLVADLVQRAGIDVHGTPGIVIIIGLSIAAGWLLFSLVESPFMRLRERWFPGAGGRAFDRSPVNKHQPVAGSVS